MELLYWEENGCQWVSNLGSLKNREIIKAIYAELNYRGCRAVQLNLRVLCCCIDPALAFVLPQCLFKKCCLPESIGLFPSHPRIQREVRNSVSMRVSEWLCVSVSA